jgi:hypothetical protein
VLVNDVVSVMAAHQPGVQACGTARLHNRLVCLREPKHIGAITGILIIFNIPVIL